MANMPSDDSSLNADILRKRHVMCFENCFRCTDYLDEPATWTGRCFSHLYFVFLPHILLHWKRLGQNIIIFHVSHNFGNIYMLSFFSVATIWVSTTPAAP